MKVLVTGASGFRGSYLAEQLADQGHSVRLRLRETSSRRFLSGFAYGQAPGDVTDARTLSAAIEGVDAVIHAAGLVKARSEAEFYAVNGEGTTNLVRAAERSTSVKRFIYVS